MCFVCVKYLKSKTSLWSTDCFHSRGLRISQQEKLVPQSKILLCCVSRYISSCYSLPSIRLDRPWLVMTASCPSAVRPLEHFWVKYTLLNNLQDFLAVRLVWSSEGEELTLATQSHFYFSVVQKQQRRFDCVISSWVIGDLLEASCHFVTYGDFVNISVPSSPHFVDDSYSVLLLYIQ